MNLIYNICARIKLTITTAMDTNGLTKSKTTKFQLVKEILPLNSDVIMSLIDENIFIKKTKAPNHKSNSDEIDDINQLERKQAVKIYC
jgi:hypothetical protein